MLSAVPPNNQENDDSSRLEPVDRAAVDERRVLPQAIAEGTADRTECNDNVQVLTTATHEVRVDR